ncbi:MAG TPA: PKD domain-containing protein [Tepidisphaeraceae bacterium]|nr:PKD domain-containing protein [Tepidisphaeraceae bacterium]
MNASARRNLCRAVIESLEPRRLLSATSLSDGVLSVTGDNTSDNTIAVDQIGNGLLAAIVNGHSQVYPIVQINQIQITDGNEQNSVAIDKALAVPTTVYSYGPGDKITGGDPYVTVVQMGGSTADAAVTPQTAVDTDTLAAVITAVSPVDICAGQAMQVNAINSDLAGGTPLNTTFNWDFGDTTPESQFNELQGFNAAHVYNTPGEFTVTLTVTAASGQTSSATMQVNVSDDTPMQTVYVSSSGNDASSGLSPADPIQSLARVQQLLTQNTQVLFQDGDTFDMSSGLYVGYSNVTFASYGSGPQPILLWTGGSADDYTMISSSSATFNLTVTGLTFDSIYNQGADESPPSAIAPAGSDIAIVGDTFLNIDYAVNLNSAPTGVLVEDCNAPQVTYSGQILPAGTDDVTSTDVTGLRDYLVWAQGQDIAIFGNTAANSTRQHIVRVGGASLLNIEDNNFTNLSRTAVDSNDIAKPTIDLQMGTYAFIAQNTLSDGPLCIGPLTTQPSGFDAAVVEDNTLEQTNVQVAPDATDVVLADNVTTLDNNAAYYVAGANSTTGWIVSNLTITGNTAANNGQTGNFLILAGPANGITLTNNLYVAPNLVFGDNGSTPVYVSTSDGLSSFSQISGNVWPVNTSSSEVSGDENFVGPIWLNSYVSAQQWNSQPQVEGDLFENVTLPSDYQDELTQFTQTGVQLFAAAA